MSNTPECYYQPAEFAMILDTWTGIFTHRFVTLIVMQFRPENVSDEARHIPCTFVISSLFSATFRRNCSREISRVRCLRHHEDTMNCQSCNTRVDYLFLTNCEQCGNQVGPADVSQVDLMHLDPIVEPRLNWKRRVVNLVYVLMSSLAGLVSGAVALYVFFAVLCITILNNLP